MDDEPQPFMLARPACPGNHMKIDVLFSCHERPSDWNIDMHGSVCSKNGSVRDHACNIPRASYQALCIHIVQPYGHNMIVLAFNRSIDLYQSTRPKWLCTLIAFHYNKWNVHVFVFGVCITPNELFQIAPDFKKKVHILVNISWIIFVISIRCNFIHHEYIDEFRSDSKGSILRHGWAACDESCCYMIIYL